MIMKKWCRRYVHDIEGKNLIAFDIFQIPSARLEFKDVFVFDKMIKIVTQMRANMMLLQIKSHYNDVIMSVMTSQIISFTIVYSMVYFRRRSKKTSKLRVTGLCEGNSPVTGEFPTKGQWRAKCFHLMTSSWKHMGNVLLTHNAFIDAKCFK